MKVVDCMGDLFENLETPCSAVTAPLAERMRPKCLEDVIGQNDVVQSAGVIISAIKK
jgi:replication-associated recombination protein RarA